MEHNTCRENLSAYLDNELATGEKLGLESHLASCEACARELAELRKISAVFKKHVMQPVPPALKEEVFAEKNVAPFFSGWLKPVLVLSAAACVVMILVLPKVRQREQTYSPALFTNSYSEGRSDRGAASAQSSLDLFKARPGMPSPVQSAPGAGTVSSLSGETSGGSVSAMSASSVRPQSLGKGAYGQAKFAGRGGISAGEGDAAYRLGSSMSRGAANSTLSGAMAAKSGLSMSAAADKSAARPEWLGTIIRQCQAGQPGNPSFAVWRYSYKGKTVYYLPPQCCDQYSQLYDEAGKLLCAPDGGKTGQGDGRCADFTKLRTGGVLLWQDPRK